MEMEEAGEIDMTDDVTKFDVCVSWTNIHTTIELAVQKFIAVWNDHRLPWL